MLADSPTRFPASISSSGMRFVIGIRSSLLIMGPIGEGRVADEQTFNDLLNEFRRVGVDPDTFSAMLALRPEEAVRALRALPDNAGPTAFLAKLRQQAIHPNESEAEDVRLGSLPRRRRDKSA